LKLNVRRKLQFYLETGKIPLQWAVPIFMRGMKKYYLESRSRGISYMKQTNGRLNGLVTYCVETALCDKLLKKRYKEG
jgi:hypothetical protein